jgi:hypothetical protein
LRQQNERLKQQLDAAARRAGFPESLALQVLC